ncbi:MAG TPA: class I SAM-dependent methyltransferase [Candidatus Eisenbacteria bacterium]|nr:class I SAM-dependent methyltransferase [Candidatus Eisenbacteria bacterium]
MQEHEDGQGAETRTGAAAALPIPPSNGGRVLDGMAQEGPDQLVDAYDGGFAEAIAMGGEVYPTLSPLLLASHERRVALLEALPVGDLSTKVCVDYGVGSWGFGQIYPKLRHCAYAIGMDISRSALEASARVSAEHRWPYGNNYMYITSRGDRFALDDASVDLFFAGECIEHVENVEAFLDEIHRVLRPGGMLVLTTPNADGYLYRLRGERYCPSVEHLSLMGWGELSAYLAPRFDVVVAHGFNASVQEDWDASITEPAFIKAWTEQFQDRPDLATSIVLLARRRDAYRRPRYLQQTYHHESKAIAYEGRWEIAPLHRTMTARRGMDADASSLAFDFEGTDLLLFLWSHDWSGYAFIEVDGIGADVLNLYGSQGGFRRVHLRGLAPGRHRLTLRGGEIRDPRSHANQLIFYQAIAYTRVDDQGESMSSSAQDVPANHNFSTRPARFGVIYTTPAHMTAPERVLVYSLVLGLRPQRCLEIGTHKGGSALIIGAALDDLGAGRLVCVDPQPLVAPEHWAQVSHRATMIAGPSPAVLPQAIESAGGLFDFALIDGDHEYPGVVRDIEGTLRVLAPNAYMLFHDANYFEVARAIDEMLCKHADRLVDCGMLSVQQTPEDRVVSGHPVIWGGLRLVRYHKPG